MATENPSSGTAERNRIIAIVAGGVGPSGSGASAEHS
jgi:hypothetical protein